MPAETSVVSQLAGRYAAALFDLAKDKGALDEVEDDLARIDTMLAESADLRRLVRSPVISAEDKARAIGALMERAEVSSLVARFMGVVAQHRRLFALRPMIRRFVVLIAEHRGEVAAEVTSARPLSAAQTAAVSRALAKVVGREVKVAATVDEGLIGGLMVKVGSRMVDSSIRSKLARLRLALRGVG